MLQAVYERLPETVQPLARRSYHRLRPRARRLYHAAPGTPPHPETRRKRFIDAAFPSRSRFETYQQEFQTGRCANLFDEARAEHARLVGPDAGFGGTPTHIGELYYALVRELEPAVVVETGVCNGCSTFYLLAALDRNDAGRLISIDYPMRADEDLQSFRAETYTEFGGAVIPADKEPGWILPDALTDRWTLQEGKSQRVLPQVLAELDQPVDVFIHDGEHSVPAMHMEFDLAWAHLADDGWLLADDTSWNDAWEQFVETRKPPVSGRLAESLGWLRRCA